MVTNNSKIGAPLLLCLVFATAAIAYSPGLSGEFMHDDFPNIFQNNLLRIDSLSAELLWRAAMSGISSDTGRPLAMLSFALSYYVGGMSPGVFKAMNLGIHLLNGLLLLSLARVLVRQLRPTSLDYFPLWVTAAWLLHPIQISTVLYVVQRMAELATFFTLAGLLLYMRMRTEPLKNKWGQAASGLGVVTLWLLGFLSKENAALAPFLAIAIEWFVLSKTKHRAASWVLSGIKWVTVITVLFVLVMIMTSSGPFSSTVSEFRGFSPQERGLTQFRVLWYYTKMIVMPVLSDFSLFHDDFILSTGWLSPWTTLLSALGWLMAIAVMIAFSDRLPLLSLGIAWFLIGHLLESTVLMLELVYEHRNYLPAFGLIIAISELGRHALAKIRARVGSGLATAVCVMPLAVVTLQTTQLAYAWGNPIRLSQLNVENHPRSARAQQDAGVALMITHLEELSDKPNIREKINEYYRRSADYDKNYKWPLLARIRMACKYGDHLDPAWLKELIERWRHSRPMAVDSHVVMHMTEISKSGDLCLDLSLIIEMYEAYADNPYYDNYDKALTLISLADIVLQKTQNSEEAKRYYLRALGFATEHNTLLLYAKFLVAIGDYRQAKRILDHLPVGHYKIMDWQPLEIMRLNQAISGKLLNAE